MSDMPCWFYDEKALRNTPSIQDGINHKTECEYRKEGANLIVQIGSQMELGYNTLATGVVFFHRFYMFHSFKAFSPYITACCCLFLAGKAEETPKKSKDIIKIAKTFLSEDKLLALGENVREEVMTMEKILLQTLKFDLKVCHPYSFLLKYAKCLKGDKRRKQKMVQMAWTFINDSLCTTLSIQWEPEIIAIAVIHLAGKLVRLKILGWSRRRRTQTHWWEIFVEDLSLQVVEDICHQVLDIYAPLSRYFVPDSPQIMKVEPKNATISQLNSSPIGTIMNDAAIEFQLESSIDTLTSISLKDPRLENGSVFAKNYSSMNTACTPVLVSSSIALPGNMQLTSSPATPTIPQPIDQTLQDYSQMYTVPTMDSRDPREMSRFLSVQGNFNSSAIPSALNPLETCENQMFEKGFNDAENQTFENNSNRDDYNDNRLMRNRGFGCVNNDYNDNTSENRPMRNRDFRRYDRNNRGGYSPRRFTRRSNNQGDMNCHNENRPLDNRGFENDRNNNSNRNENQPLGKRGFGNDRTSGNDQNENRPFRNRGFGNDNRGNSRDCNEIQPFRNRGFGNDNRDNGSDHNENRFFRNRGFRNDGRGNRSDHNENRNYRNRGFGNNNHDNSNDYNENRPFRSRGFGNDERGNRSDHNENRNFRNRGFGNDERGNSNDYNENRPFRNRGFGNNNNNNNNRSPCDESKSIEKRGSDNAHGDGDTRDKETKLCMKRGFGNSSSLDDNCNGYDSRPRMGHHGVNRFQRSDPYPRRFNNNHENDRYSHNDTNGDLSKGFAMCDAPGKRVDKQRFYYPSEENASIKVEENASMKVEKNSSIKVEKNASIKVEKNSSIKVEENSSIKVEENASIKVEENASINVKEEESWD